jgi:hypothetical protein
LSILGSNYVIYLSTATTILVVVPTALVFLVKDIRNMTNEEDSRAGVKAREHTP